MASFPFKKSHASGENCFCRSICCTNLRSCMLRSDRIIFFLLANGQSKLLQPPLSRSFWITAEDSQISSIPPPQLELQMEYLAPEFAAPGQGANFRTDIYAIGCLLYQMLTGQPPFPRGDLQSKLHRRAIEPVQPLEQWGVPTQLAQIIKFAMAKESMIRFQSASASGRCVALFHRSPRVAES